MTSASHSSLSTVLFTGTKLAAGAAGVATKASNGVADGGVHECISQAVQDPVTSVVVAPPRFDRSLISMPRMPLAQRSMGPFFKIRVLFGFGGAPPAGKKKYVTRGGE